MRIRHASKGLESVKRIKSLNSRGLGRLRTGLMLVVLTAGFLLPASSPPLNKLFWRTGLAQANTSIVTYAGDCQTAKSDWDLGGTVCALASSAPDDSRIAWVAPNGVITEVNALFSGSMSDTYDIPTGSDPFAQVGTWTVIIIDLSGVVSAAAEFVVRDPARATADLSVGNYGPLLTSAGNTITYRVELTNKGPDEAQNVVLNGPVPGGTTFVSESQVSGPAATCTAPPVGSSAGAISCSIDALPANSTAIFAFTFAVNAGLAAGDVISSAVSVSSSTNELHQPNNSASASSTIFAATTGCAITCPSVGSITTSGCSAVVSYPAPSTAGDCGSSPEGGGGVSCNPPSGSTFPVGNTTVTCTAISGDSCSFLVSVDTTGSSGPLSITCPADVTIDSDSVSAGTALVIYPAPAATGNCATVACAPPSGSIFPIGSTTVTCTVSDLSGNTDSCSFAVTVTGGGGGCAISCPGDITQSSSGGQCSAVVSYSAPTTSGDCGTVTCNPPSGSTFPPGVTVVTCVSTAGAGCDFSVTVVPEAAPTITTCASAKTVSVVADCEGVIPNLLNEVIVSGCNVAVSQSPAAGSTVPPGTYTVTITAENAAGEATCTVAVTVADSFTGFFPPVANLPTVNVVNAGRGVPVKFSLGGDKGLNIFASGYPASVQLDCNSGDPMSDVEETVTAGGSTLSYDASTGQYTYVWKTESSWAGSCRQLVIRFLNGCEYRANFRFR